MDQVKEAFQKVKEDIDNLNYELNFLKNNFYELKNEMINLCELIKNISTAQQEIQSDKQTNRHSNTNFNTPTQTSTLQHTNSTIPTQTSTDSTHIKLLKPENQSISIGNRGVPTDRQTDKQTNQQTHFKSKSSYNIGENSLEEAVDIMASLDDLKKEIRLKFKRLTEQEMTVFSTLYQLSELKGFSDYKSIAFKLGLTESSIRDYIGRLIKKGIPVDKDKVNNKTIQLSISPNLKKIASLNTILQLRDLRL